MTYPRKKRNTDLNLIKAHYSALKKFFILLAILGIFGLSGCREEENVLTSRDIFQITQKNGWTQVNDQFGRNLALVPRGQDLPPELKDFPKTRIIRTPVEKVVITSGTYDPSIIIHLGAGNSIVGTSDKLEDILIPEYRELYEKNGIVHVGNWDSLDFEHIIALKPDVVLASSYQTTGKLEELGVTVLVTYTGENNGLDSRMNLFILIGKLYQKDEEAKAMVDRIQNAFSDIRERIKGMPRPTVMCGLYFNNRILGMSGRYWFSELLDIAGGDYILKSFASDGTELSLEEFIAKGKTVDIYFAQLLYETNIFTKADLVKAHEDLGLFKAFSKGGTVAIPNRRIFQDPANMDKVTYEMAEIFHPTIFPEKPTTYFTVLPDE
ncbi:MAG: ABC transporter substrate-binding protein [Deltaproteobacteria bacterium]|jgi:ABC-type Fe3+-hydroxamate transport system substrate-binding protein|nr:ABC transporter substrate-binding protein [Deltaproteobacteria bacterium]